MNFIKFDECCIDLDILESIEIEEYDLEDDIVEYNIHVNHSQCGSHGTYSAFHLSNDQAISLINQLMKKINLSTIEYCGSDKQPQRWIAINSIIAFKFEKRKKDYCVFVRTEFKEYANIFYSENDALSYYKALEDSLLVGCLLNKEESVSEISTLSKKTKELLLELKDISKDRSEEFEFDKKIKKIESYWEVQRFLINTLEKNILKG